MDPRSHDRAVPATESSTLTARVEALKEYVEAFPGPDDGGPTFHEAERHVRGLVAALECAATAAVLERYEPESDEFVYEGRTFRRMPGRSGSTYAGMPGGLRVERYLYREVGVRNGPTIVPLELRAGIVEGLLTPLAAQATAFLTQALPSRDAKEVTNRLGVLPVSRTTLARTAEAMGQRWEEHRLDAEDAVMASFEVPEEAVAVSVSVDRVSVPMAEPRTPRRTRSGKMKRPIDVVYRMAYCGVLTLHGAEGNALASIRYGRMPEEGASNMLTSSLIGDLVTILATHPDLKLVTLADGAAEMQNILDDVTDGLDVTAQFVDFWHLVEKLAAAISSTGRDVPAKLAAWKAKLKEDDKAIEQIAVELRTWSLDYSELPSALHEAITYVTNNQGRMRYASAVAANLPIGSGHVEATCKTLVSVRMKRSGARWKTSGGQAIMSLRCLATSTRWDAGMDFLLGTYRSECAANAVAA